MVLFALLLVLSIWSLFVGVLDVELSELLQGDSAHLEVFLISRLPVNTVLPENTSASWWRRSWGFPAITRR